MIRRKMRLIVVAGLALMLTFLLVGQVTVANGTSASGVGRYIVVFNTEVNDAAKGALVAQFGGVTDKEIALLGNANVVLLPPRAVEALAGSAQVLRVDEDAIVYALPKPDNPGKKPPKEDEPPPEEPAEELPWGVDQIDAELAWVTSTGAGVKVAIIDTGIDKDHPDLVANIKPGVNFVAKGRTVDPNKWDDDNGHGTHVAGSVAAVDNDIGVIGVAPQAWLYGVKVLDKRGRGYLSDVILGIEWAIDNHMQVINLSLGTSSDVQSLHDAVDAAYAEGIVLVAAAGNSGDTNPDDDVIYPAKYGSVIAVAATDSNNTRASWSGDGPAVELAAPGVAIYSTWKGGEYDTKSGTSMASPHVAGTVALLLAANPELTPDEVRATLQTTADDLWATGFDNYYGYGLVDADEATTGTESP
jgi:subtilisin family serine protease